MPTQAYVNLCATMQMLLDKRFHRQRESLLKRYIAPTGAFTYVRTNTQPKCIKRLMRFIDSSKLASTARMQTAARREGINDGIDSN